MSGKSAKNKTSQIKNNDVEKTGHDSMSQTRSAAGLVTRMCMLAETTGDQGYRLVERVVDSCLGSWWSSTRRPGLMDWALLGIILLGAYAFFLYGDARATFEHSFNLLGSVLQGRTGDFYRIAIEHISTGHPAVYDIPLYLPFGLWNLPTYIIYRITGLQYLLSMPAQPRLKTMMVPAALFAAKVLVDIMRDLGVSRQRSKRVAFFSLPSVTLFIPVLATVQYDIIIIVFILLGSRVYLYGRLGRFLLWFAIANTLKLFALFIFVPPLLLREERLRAVALQVVVGLIGLVGYHAIYHGDVAYKASTGGFMSSMLQRLTAVRAPWQSSMIPIFVVFMVGIVISAYLRRPQGTKALAVDVAYTCMAIYLVFATVVPFNLYWAVMVLPFAVLIISLNPCYVLLSSVSEMGIGTASFLMHIFIGFPMYNRSILDQLFLPYLMTPTAQPRYETSMQFLDVMGISRQDSSIVGFTTVCALAFLFISFLRTEMVGKLGQGERVPRSVAWSRLTMPTAFSALVLLPHFVPAAPVAYLAVTDTPRVGSVNILGDGTRVSETVTLSSTVETSPPNIAFLAGNIQWLGSSVVNVEVTDTPGVRVFKTVVPVNSLHEGLHEFPVKGLVLRGGEKCIVTIISELTEGDSAIVEINPAVDQFSTTENGMTANGDLLVSINSRTK